MGPGFGLGHEQQINIPRVDGELLGPEPPGLVRQSGFPARFDDQLGVLLDRVLKPPFPETKLAGGPERIGWARTRAGVSDVGAEQSGTGVLRHPSARTAMTDRLVHSRALRPNSFGRSVRRGLAHVEPAAQGRPT